VGFHPPTFGTGCAVSLAVHVRAGERWLAVLCAIFSDEPWRGTGVSWPPAGVRSSDIIRMQGGEKVLIL